MQVKRAIPARDALCVCVLKKLFSGCIIHCAEIMLWNLRKMTMGKKLYCQGPVSSVIQEPRELPTTQCCGAQQQGDFDHRGRVSSYLGQHNTRGAHRSWPFCMQTESQSRIIPIPPRAAKGLQHVENGCNIHFTCETGITVEAYSNTDWEIAKVFQRGHNLNKYCTENIKHTLLAAIPAFLLTAYSGVSVCIK